MVAGAKIEALQSNLQTVIQGKQESIELLVIALLANGSVLMEDVPGLGKTTLAKSLAVSLDVQYSRIQFTPDMLPADIVGGSIYNPKDGTFNFRPGPIFCQILLADEINRASPRTQSALLEAMAELQVTIEGECHELPSPFLVLATQNPVEFHGTYPLPEAQLDRFMMMLSLGYPSPEIEVQILQAQAKSHPVDQLKSVLSAAEVVDLQQQVRNVLVSDSVAGYIVDIINGTRESTVLKLGVSTRGSLMLYRGCQAAAFAQGRTYVTPDDVQRMSGPILAHRLTLNTKAKYDGTNKYSVLKSIVESIPVPV
ncbi:MoxR family ATPase [bacterium AH-315-P07]|nr:MoxR family ATPase [bacterium AH-315-P07]